MAVADIAGQHAAAANGLRIGRSIPDRRYASTRSRQICGVPAMLVASISASLTAGSAAFRSPWVQAPAIAPSSISRHRAAARGDGHRILSDEAEPKVCRLAAGGGSLERTRLLLKFPASWESAGNFGVFGPPKPA